jgi:hypothetical protein
MRAPRPVPAFLAALLILAAAVPAPAQNIPKPEDVLGFKVGDDYRLATYPQAMEYFKRLAAASDRVKLFDIGPTSMGQTMTYALISLPQNLAALEKHKDIARRLSLARLSPVEARALAREGRAVVYLDGGLHASECAPAQHNIQLAYDLAAAQDAKTVRILNDVILVLVFANPDGMNLLADWYHPNVGTPYEVAPLPRLYHIYAGHDNNRDSLLANLVETQNITRLVNREWFPVIYYNHHQTAPFPARIWTPPNSEPTNPNVHPLLVRWQNMIGSAMGAAFDEEGKEGAISRIVFDTWYPGYMTQVVDSHNIISILTETALYRYATPRFYTVRDFPAAYQDLTMSAFYPNPWRGGWWRLRDAVDYCLTASKSVLDIASKYREELLFNKYRMGADTIGRFRKEPPYAYILPADQADPGNLSLLLNRMTLLGLDVYKAEESFASDGISYPAGTYILPLSQPFGLFLKNAFEEQKYPDLRKYPDLWQGLVASKAFEGAPFEAYDMMGWTLPHQFGLTCVPAQTPVEVKMSPQKEVRVGPGKVEGRASFGYLLSASENASYAAANRVLKAGGRVSRIKKDLAVQNRTYPAGSFIIPGASVPSAVIEKIAKDLDLRVVGLADRPSGEAAETKTPRLAIYQSWMASAEEGWTRFVLDQFDFAYDILHDADVRAGSLKSKYDTLIMPDYGGGQAVVEGYAKGTMPPSYVGGITPNGLRNLKTFAESGGTIVFLNGSCEMAIEMLGAPARNVLKGVKAQDFICSGSILRMEFDPAQPLAYGMPKEAPGVFADSLAFEVSPTYGGKKEAKSVAKYAAENTLMSGWIHGEKLIKDRSAVLDVAYEKGRLVLLGFPVQFRAQPYGTFKLLFNAILN